MLVYANVAEDEISELSKHVIQSCGLIHSKAFQRIMPSGSYAGSEIGHCQTGFVAFSVVLLRSQIGDRTTISTLSFLAM